MWYWTWLYVWHRVCLEMHHYQLAGETFPILSEHLERNPSWWIGNCNFIIVSRFGKAENSVDWTFNKAITGFLATSSIVNMEACYQDYAEQFDGPNQLWLFRLRNTRIFGWSDWETSATAKHSFPCLGIAHIVGVGEGLDCLRAPTAKHRGMYQHCCCFLSLRNLWMYFAFIIEIYCQYLSTA